MTKLHIDIETYSGEDIKACGLYKYAESPDFAILLVAYARNDEPTQIVDLAQGELLPDWFTRALLDEQVLKIAHNAAFERVCFTHLLRRMHILGEQEWLPGNQWLCTMVQAARCGLPLSLKDAGAALGLEQQKMKEGQALIRKFCCKHATGLLGSERVMPSEAPEDWETFKAYCIRDVDVERSIEQLCSWYPVSDFEQRLYGIDQDINDHGVLLDLRLVEQAVRMRDLCNARLSVEAASLTGLKNPNSLPALKAWYEMRTGQPAGDIWTKGEIASLIASDDAVISRVAQIRSELGKTSNAKYDKMLEVVNRDGRARGITQFYGTRTGRWAGRLLQLQNLPQNHLRRIESARQLVKDGDADILQLVYENIPNTLSQLIRTAFVAPEGKLFAVCDFSAIEARVVAWVAGEDWVLDTFRKGGDIYCATASQMFGVPVAKHGPNADLRQKGKISVLALGYGGGTGALTAMGAIKMGLHEAELPEIVNKWRAANPMITQLWSDIERAATYTSTTKLPCSSDGLTFIWESDPEALCIQLPSGRLITYPNMTTGVNRFAKTSLKFKGVNQETGKYEWIETWGGKLTENVVQALARDCLAFTMTKMVERGFTDICFHVHDEIICEVDCAERLDEVCDIFSIVPDWAGGLPLKGAGYTTPFYLKD